MAQLSDIVDTSALAELKHDLVLDEDPMFLNRTRFLEYCEALAQDRADNFRTLDDIRDELYSLDQQWRATARAMAINKRKQHK